MTMGNVSPRELFKLGELLKLYARDRYLKIPEADPFICRWCHGPITEKRRRSWCSDRCTAEYNEIRLSLDPAALRTAAFQCDRGVCAICGLDTEWLRAHLWYEGDDARDEIIAKYPWTATRKFGKHLWELDHEKPVIEGGGCAPLHLLRTLCLHCHHGVTKELRGRLRRKPKTELGAKLERKAKREAKKRR